MICYRDLLFPCRAARYADYSGKRKVRLADLDVSNNWRTKPLIIRREDGSGCLLGMDYLILAK